MENPRAFNQLARKVAAVAWSAMAVLACNDPDDRPAEWAFIAPVILAPSCATGSCHSKAAAESGLDLSEPSAAYTSLFRQRTQFFVPGPPGAPTATCRPERGGTVCLSTRPLVQPCRPDESRLVNMLRARGAERMPPDRPLPLADIELIERWILSGAKERASDSMPACGGLPDAAATPPPPSDSGVDAMVPGPSDGGAG